MMTSGAREFGIHNEKGTANKDRRVDTWGINPIFEYELEERLQ